ncbi:hypothetical protein BKA63DRAFT_165980 [Paraphoma chrysanthemicola]|nr:hypothetical protein BKA63DRAFT_165980 [Paraphoma chrysanthemicola]
MRLVAFNLALFLGATALPTSENPQGGQACIDPSVQNFSFPADENAVLFAHKESEDPATTSTSTQKDSTNTDFLAVSVFKAKQWSSESKIMWTLGKPQHKWLENMNSPASRQVELCYNVTSDWNNVISSLAISEGFACRFYPNGDCASGSLCRWSSFLRSKGPSADIVVDFYVGESRRYVSDLGLFGWKDIISSYRCWR